MTSKPDTAGRSVQAQTQINAPAEHVWKALTDASEITRWFSTDATIEPHVGGAWSLSWYGDFPWNTRIEIFEPNRHLRTVMVQAPHSADAAGSPDSPQALPVVVDYFLESHGGQTTLRIVHSGFGAGADWDEEYEGVRTGWDFEIQVLRHYVERHRGLLRHMFWLRAAVDTSHDAAWRQLTTLFSGLAQAHYRPGDRVTLDTALGERLSGAVITHESPRAFGIVADDSSIFRLAVDKCGGHLEAGIWVESWGDTAAQVEAQRRRWSAALQQAFPQARLKGAAA
jgi:uncharacterized protein YndB with AHSA1/START domain